MLAPAEERVRSTRHATSISSAEYIAVLTRLMYIAWRACRLSSSGQQNAEGQRIPADLLTHKTHLLETQTSAASTSPLSSSTPVTRGFPSTTAVLTRVTLAEVRIDTPSPAATSARAFFTCSCTFLKGSLDALLHLLSASHTHDLQNDGLKVRCGRHAHLHAQFGRIYGDSVKVLLAMTICHPKNHSYLLETTNWVAHPCHRQ